MRIFMIEWFDTTQQRYQQEYYRTVETMAARMLQLDTCVVQSNPEVTTVFLND